ncbi:hypothetical protein Leryth_008919 [Lithospermum erythrorhizon]|nr:hypothetical protein Leryth_008919 [Lithospermum erythrorhizon]
MGKRRFAQVVSDDDDGGETPLTRRSNHHQNDDDDEDEATKIKNHQMNKRKRMKSNFEEEEIEEGEEVAKALGDVIRVSGKGRFMRTHFNKFQYDGSQYQLEDSVLLAPEGECQKPYVAIIKDISVDHKGSINVMRQWFYRPEEAEKRGGGHWQSHDVRELFYSFHRDEGPAETVMHKCVVHFIPLNKQIPCRTEHPGFIVQKVYCTERRTLFKLTDKDYEDNKQEEIDLLVQKTMSRLGDLPDIEHDEGDVDHEEQLMNMTPNELMV